MDPTGRAATGLVDYVHDVARGLGVAAENAVSGIEIEFDLLTSAYIVLPYRARTFPTYDLALVWDEESGWAVAIETDPAYPPIAIAYQSRNLLPSPPTVIGFVNDLLAGRQPGQPHRPTFRHAATMMTSPPAWSTIATPDRTVLRGRADMPLRFSR